MRLVQPSDTVFEQALYASSRADLQALGLPAPLLQTLLAQQQQAQAHGMALHYPQAQRWVIEEKADNDACPLGRVVLCELAEPQPHLRILDLAVLPGAQRQGIAMGVLRAVQASAQAANLALRLAVAHSNLGAQALYRKAGFLPDLPNSPDSAAATPSTPAPAPDALLLQMHWKPVVTLEAHRAKH